jgi:hypothetical protein
VDREGSDSVARNDRRVGSFWVTGTARRGRHRQRRRWCACGSMGSAPGCHATPTARASGATFRHSLQRACASRVALGRSAT